MGTPQPNFSAKVEMSKDLLLSANIPRAFWRREALDLDILFQLSDLSAFGPAKAKLSAFLRNSRRFHSLGGSLYVRCDNSRTGLGLVYSVAVSLLVRGHNVYCMSGESPAISQDPMPGQDSDFFLLFNLPINAGASISRSLNHVISYRSAEGLPIVIFGSFPLSHWVALFGDSGFRRDAVVIEFPSCQANTDVIRVKELRHCLQ